MLKLNQPMRAPDAGEDAGGTDSATATSVADTQQASTPAVATPAPAATQAAPATPVVAKAATPSGDGKPADAAAPADKPGYWPADWRDTVSKGDAKVLSRMSRYASPAAAMEALIAAQNRISSGELKPSLKANAKPEEIAAWRAEHGIPETPDKYDLGKDVPGDPKLQGILLKAAHETNQTPDQVKATVKSLQEMNRMLATERAEQDIELQQKGEDALRSEWGPEFRRNINLIHGMLDATGDQTLKDKLLLGRLSDGTPVGSSPEVLKMLAGLALIQNPSGVVVPSAEANPLQGVEDEIGKIEKTMKENRKEYNKDEKLQARYRDLLEAREKLKPRKAA